ncbi:hypothetical protein C8R43DRAFT_1003126, partial [Mycena crocata]
LTLTTSQTIAFFNTKSPIPISFTMFSTTQVPVSQANCGNASCGCGDTCGCKAGECKC